MAAGVLARLGWLVTAAWGGAGVLVAGFGRLRCCWAALATLA